MSASWMRIPDWLRFQVEEFSSTYKHNVFSWCNLRFLSYGLCFGVVLSLDVCILVTLSVYAVCDPHLFEETTAFSAGRFPI